MALLKIGRYSSSFSQHSLKDSWLSHSHLPGITPQCSNFIWPDKPCYNLINNKNWKIKMIAFVLKKKRQHGILDMVVLSLEKKQQR